MANGFEILSKELLQKIKEMADTYPKFLKIEKIDNPGNGVMGWWEQRRGVTFTPLGSTWDQKNRSHNDHYWLTCYDQHQEWSEGHRDLANKIIETVQKECVIKKYGERWVGFNEKLV